MSPIKVGVTVRKTVPSFLRLKTTRAFVDGLADMVESFELTPNDIVMVVAGREQIGDSDLIQWGGRWRSWKGHNQGCNNEFIRCNRANRGGVDIHFSRTRGRLRN